MGQIQKSAVEPDKRNFLSRIFNVKSDDGRVAAWRSDLDRILRIFEVRSTACFLPTLLTVSLQTELALHTNVAVSGVHKDVVDIREDVANARELISDVHRAVLKDQEAGSISNQMVSNHGVLFTVEIFLHFLGSKQVCSFNSSRRPEILPLSTECSGNRLPHPRGPVSDGRS